MRVSQQRDTKPHKSDPTVSIMPTRRASYGSNSNDEEEPSPLIQYDPILLSLGSITFKLSNLKYITFLFIGIALLWPWNCFLSASAYYSERFEYYPSLVKIYSSTMMTVSTLTSTTTNYYLAQRQKNANYSKRINVGMCITIGVFIIMGLSCVSFLNLSSLVFFPMLMVMILISSVATCLSQNGCMAIVNVMGPLYANAVMVGQSISGVLPSIALIISVVMVGPREDNNPQEKEHVKKNFGLFIYFVMASVIAIVSIFLYKWCNSYTDESKYQSITLEDDHIVDESSLDDLESNVKKYVPFPVLWSKLKFIVSTISLTFAISLIFPVFASSVESTTKSNHFFFNKQIFIPFIYLLWNIGDLSGRLCCLTKFFQIQSPHKLILFSSLRVLFIPIFLGCNIRNQGYYPILNDWFYFAVQFLFGFTNGQLASSSFMIVGSFVNDDEKEAAGGFTTIFLSVGLAAGSIFSYLLVVLIN